VVIRGVCWNPDGKRLASVSTDGTMRVWDADTGQAVQVLGPEGGGFTVTWSPDGKRLANAPGDTTVRVWDAETGKEVLQLKHMAGILGLSWGRGGRLAGASPDGMVRVWKVAD
jgi:WD40 repeat protein